MGRVHKTTAAEAEPAHKPEPVESTQVLTTCSHRPLMPVVLIDTERIAQTKLGRIPGSRLTNRSRWRGQRFWLATRRDAGRIPAAGFNRGTTTWPAKRS